jgi:hypothetical protein
MSVFARDQVKGYPIMKRIVIMLYLGMLSCSVLAQSIDAPVVTAGDIWTYRATVEKGSASSIQMRQEILVTRVTASTIFYIIKSSSTPIPQEVFSGLDWGRMRSVNGKEIAINKPFSFPLAEGKTWELAYDEDKPGGNYLRQSIENKFVVVGYETVDVPAGSFLALKIEAEGRWSARVAASKSSASAQTDVQGNTTAANQTRNLSERDTSGRLYKAYWYSPEIKRWVKSIEENYSSSGTRSERFTSELESFKPGR